MWFTGVILIFFKCYAWKEIPLTSAEHLILLGFKVKQNQAEYGLTFIKHYVLKNRRSLYLIKQKYSFLCLVYLFIFLISLILSMLSFLSFVFRVFQAQIQVYEHN